MNAITGKIEAIREGEENREGIYEFIFENRNHGVKAGDIINFTMLSDEAVHNHLAVLLSNGRIRKSETRRYYPEISTENEFLAFSKRMSEYVYWFADKELMESNSETKLPYGIGKYPRLKLHEKLKIDLPANTARLEDIIKSMPKASFYFMRMLAGPITSKKYCSTCFGDNKTLERCLFEFSNRIGAYVTYIYLQSMYPIADSKLNSKDRSKFAKNLRRRSISVEDLFSSFIYLMSQLGLTPRNLDPYKYKRVPELSARAFKILSDALQEVYPNLYIALENRWLHSTCNSIALSKLSTASSTCFHEWEQRDFFKYGSCFYCKKCHKVSDESTMTKIK